MFTKLLNPVNHLVYLIQKHNGNDSLLILNAIPPIPFAVTLKNNLDFKRSKFLC